MGLVRCDPSLNLDRCVGWGVAAVWPAMRGRAGSVSVTRVRYGGFDVRHSTMKRGRDGEISMLYLVCSHPGVKGGVSSAPPLVNGDEGGHVKQRRREICNRVHVSVLVTSPGTETPSKYELMISVSPTGTGTPSKYELISVSPAGTGTGTPSKYELMIYVSPTGTGTGTPSKYELMIFYELMISVSPIGTGTGTGTPSKYELILWSWPPSVSAAAASDDAKNEFIASFVSANVSSTGTPIKFELISSSATGDGDGDRDGVIIGDVVSTSKSLPPFSNSGSCKRSTVYTPSHTSLSRRKPVYLCPARASYRVSSPSPSSPRCAQPYIPSLICSSSST
nr:protein FAR1-RELATED SEQUENCE 5-like [Ipomoea batatas]